MLIKVSIESLLGTVLYPLASLTSDICTLFVYNVLSTCWTTFCADPFLSIQAVRQLSAGKGVGRSTSSPGSPRGEEGGKIRQQRLRARSARGEKEKALHRNCAKKSTEEETCARDNTQAAEVRSQGAWCGGEGDCARKRAGSSAEEEHICVEERAFRARWGVRRAHGGSEKPWKQRLRVKSAQGEEALNLHCAKKCRGRDVRVRVEVRRAPWRRRICAGGGSRTRWVERVGTSRRRRKCVVSSLGVEEKVIARESSQGQVRRRSTFVWRRERSGHAGVCAGHTGEVKTRGSNGCA